MIANVVALVLFAMIDGAIARHDVLTPRYRWHWYLHHSFWWEVAAIMVWLLLPAVSVAGVAFLLRRCGVLTEEYLFEPRGERPPRLLARGRLLAWRARQRWTGTSK